MSEKIGLLDQQIRLIKKDDDLIERIIEERNIDPKLRNVIRNMLRYNVWTITQFSELSGLAVSTIANKCRPAYKNGKLSTDLDFCYPFADLEGTGPKYIVRNERSERYLP